MNFKQKLFIEMLEMQYKMWELVTDYYTTDKGIYYQEKIKVKQHKLAAHLDNLNNSIMFYLGDDNE